MVKTQRLGLRGVISPPCVAPMRWTTRNTPGSFSSASSRLRFRSFEDRARQLAAVGPRIRATVLRRAIDRHPARGGRDCSWSHPTPREGLQRDLPGEGERDLADRGIGQCRPVIWGRLMEISLTAWSAVCDGCHPPRQRPGRRAFIRRRGT